MKKLRLQSVFLTFAWLLLTTGAVLLSIAGYHYSGLIQKVVFASNGREQVASDNLTEDGLADGNVRGVESIVEQDDARAPAIAQFLERHNSPMTPYDYYGEQLVAIADKYDLDFRLLPAIAMRESNLCKNTNSKAPHNCLGFGIHSEGTLDFDSYLDGFERAARELRAYYVNEGRITTEMVGSKYAASPTWADGVNQFMAEIRYNDHALGKELKQDETNVLEYAK